MVVSLAIHAVLIVVAVSFVAVRVIVKEDPTFETKRAKRPKMPPKKIRVPVDVKKRKPKPRLRQRIVVKNKSFADIKMPEISGIKGGLGNMGGDGLGSMGFDIDIGDLFGGNSSGGNELVGTFFDLKQTKRGKPTKIAESMTKAQSLNGEAKSSKEREAHLLYISELNKFAKSLKMNDLDEYFQAPKKKYASVFMIPHMNADAAPKAYDVDDVVKPKHWAAYYKGKIRPEETGHYRFSGFADDVLLVRIRGRLVLDATHPAWRWKVTNWDSDDENNRKYPFSGPNTMVIGDWIKLDKAKPSEIEILFGECPGGSFSCQLLVEQKGKEYKHVPYGSEGQTRPVLPIFKTKEIPQELVSQMKLDSNIATIEGPSFGVVKE